jgi:Cu(I)/Ag(I) efflux system membrane protein CusA/SilA
MFETTIQLKPRDQWRPGMTTDKLVEELDRIVKVPGLANIWVPPIRNRIDMLATGIKSPVGVKVSGPSLGRDRPRRREIEGVVKNVPGVSSALAERLSGGRYIDVDIDRQRAARYGPQHRRRAQHHLGGDRRRERGRDGRGAAAFPDQRALSARGARLGRGAAPVAGADRARRPDRPGRPRHDPHHRRAADAQERERAAVGLDLRGHSRPRPRARGARHAAGGGFGGEDPAGYSVSWSGQFEYLERATQKLKIVVPATLAIIFVLLYLTFKRFDEAALILATLPFALAGGVWLLWILGHNVSVASGVGFIALAGVAAEFGVIMLIYLKHAWEDRVRAGHAGEDDLLEAIREGAVLRVRPKAMTVAVIIAGLLPIMAGSGTGSEIMQRIAAPMVGGMITAPLLSMFVIPAAYLLLRRRELRATHRQQARVTAAQ